MSWKDIWRAKGAKAPSDPTITDLMVLNGYDSGAGLAAFDALDAFSARVGVRLDIKSGDRLLEVGCGSGSWPAVAGRCSRGSGCGSVAVAVAAWLWLWQRGS